MKLYLIKRKFLMLSNDLDKHEVFTLAASLAYTTALALAPFMMILLFMASFLGPEWQEKIFSEISSSLGSHAGHTVIEIVQQARSKPTLSNISGIVGFMILAISASAIFSQLRVALDKINNIKIPASNTGFVGFLRTKLLSFGLVFGFIFLSIVSLLVSTMITALLPGGDGWYWQLSFLGVNFLMFTVLFSMLYRFVPSRPFDWKTARLSGLMSAVFYLIGKSIITTYLGHAGFESSYGAAGSFVVFLAWVYYTTLTLLISCEFTNHFILRARRWDKGILPV